MKRKDRMGLIRGKVEGEKRLSLDVKKSEETAETEQREKQSRKI
jgi:hypothetical protein